MIAINQIISIIFAACLSVGGVCESAGEPISIAHRGAPDFAPENTISSFVIAESQGADAIECDLWLTSDGKLAVCHDNTAGRVWNRDIDLSDSSMQELSTLCLSCGFTAAFPRSRSERIPEFSQVLKHISAQTRVFAELKSEGRAAADVLYDEVMRADARDRVTAISFSRDTVVYLSQRGLDCAWLVCCQNPGDVMKLDVPEGVDLDVNCSALDANTVAAQHENGRRVYCWTAAGEKEFNAMKNIGVDGITCNNLSFLSK